MAREHLLAVASLVLVTALASTTLAQGEIQQVLVNDENLKADQPSMVHVVVQPDPEVPDEQRVDVTIRVDGPGLDRTIQREVWVDGTSPRVVGVPWTPEHPGEHTITGQIAFADQVHEVPEHHVTVASSPAPVQEGWPGRAPGTFQWMIAFTVFYAVAGRIPRAELDWPFEARSRPE